MRATHDHRDRAASLFPAPVDGITNVSDSSQSWLLTPPTKLSVKHQADRFKYERLSDGASATRIVPGLDRIKGQ